MNRRDNDREQNPPPRQQRQQLERGFWARHTVAALVLAAAVGFALGRLSVLAADGDLAKNALRTTTGLYDFRLEAGSLTDFHREGWKLVWDKPGNERTLQKRGKILSFIGFYNTGKTFLLNELLPMGRKVAEGFHVVTKGLSFLEDRGVIFLDTEGVQRAVNASRLQDRVATDHFIMELSMDLSDAILFHVGQLHSQDVCRLNRLKKRARQLNPGVRFYVIHNLFSLTTQEQIDQHIESDIVNAFAAREAVVPVEVEGNEVLCPSYEDPEGAIHLVLARKGTKLGDAYNACTIAKIKSLLTTLREQSQFADVNLQDRLSTAIEHQLPLFFSHPDASGVVPQMRSPFGTTHKSARQSEESGWVVKLLSWSGSVFRWFSGEAEDDGEDVPHPAAGDASPTPMPMCDFYNNLDLGVWNVEAHDSEGALQLRLSDQEKTKSLRFYDVDMCSSVPQVAFEPNFDVYQSKDTWALAVDVLDSNVLVSYGEHHVDIMGCRALMDEDLTKEGIARDEGTNYRRFSNFALQVVMPSWVVGTRIKGRGYDLSDGVLKIVLTRDAFKKGGSVVVGSSTA